MDNWNTLLYGYHQTAGGSFMGDATNEQQASSMLVLNYQEKPLIISCFVQPAGRGYGIEIARALISVELSAPYKLTMLPATLLRKGLRDYVYDKKQLSERKEIDRNYVLETTNEEFTKLVLLDIAFRQLLLEQKGFEIKVYPSTPHSTTHTVEVSTRKLASNSIFLNPQNPEGLFLHLHGLCKAAHDAVAAYRLG